MTKTVLVKEYETDPANITPAFVEKFNNSAMLGKLDNYKWVAANKGDMSRVGLADDHLREDRDLADKSCVQLLKIYFAIDCLNILTGDRFEFGKKHTIYRANVEKRARAAVMYLQPHVKTIVYVFGMRSDTKTQDLAARDLNGQLRFINAILDGAFDIELKNDRNSRNRFYIMPSANLMLYGDHGVTVTEKWRVARQPAI